MVGDNLKAINAIFDRHHGNLDTTDQHDLKDATKKFLDDLNALPPTQRIAAAHRSNVLELQAGLDAGHDPYLYFPAGLDEKPGDPDYYAPRWRDGKLIPQFAHGELTPWTRPQHQHEKEDNARWLALDIRHEEKEARDAAAAEAAKKKLMGH